MHVKKGQAISKRTHLKTQGLFLRRKKKNSRWQDDYTTCLAWAAGCVAWGGRHGDPRLLKRAGCYDALPWQGYILTKLLWLPAAQELQLCSVCVSVTDHNYGPEISFTVFFLSSYLLGLEIRFHLHPFLMITFSDVSALLMATESRAVCDTRYLHCVHKQMKIQDFRVSAQQ